MKNKKALSAVVSTLLIVVLMIISFAVVWGTVQNLAKSKLDKASSCNNLFEKIQLNSDYTCYDETSNQIQFSISRADLDLDYLMIGLIFEESSNIYSMYEDSRDISGLTNYPNGDTGVSLPGKESGKTYFIEGVTTIPSSIEIAPVINGNNCEIIDKVEDVPNCL